LESVAFGDCGGGAEGGFDADVVIQLDVGAAELDFVAGPLGQGHDFAVVFLHGVVDEAGEEEAAEVFAVAVEAGETDVEGVVDGVAVTNALDPTRIAPGRV